MSFVCPMFWSERTLSIRGLGGIIAKAIIYHYLTMLIKVELVHYICHNS
jgi:hypothetical protein